MVRKYFNSKISAKLLVCSFCFTYKVPIHWSENFIFEYSKRLTLVKGNFYLVHRDTDLHMNMNACSRNNNQLSVFPNSSDFCEYRWSGPGHMRDLIKCVLRVRKRKKWRQNGRTVMHRLALVWLSQKLPSSLNSSNDAKKSCVSDRGRASKSRTVRAPCREGVTSVTCLHTADAPPSNTFFFLQSFMFLIECCISSLRFTSCAQP